MSRNSNPNPETETIGQPHRRDIGRFDAHTPCSEPRLLQQRDRMPPTKPTTPDEPRPNATLSVDLDLLEPSPFQPRKHIDPTALAAFAQTLKAAGQLQPIAVRPKAPGRWEIVAGHRRTAAFKLLRDGAATDEERRRFTLIQAVVVDAPTDRKVALAAYVENAAREALSLVDEADALAVLRELGAGATAGELAKETGQAERRVRRLLRLAEAPKLVKAFVTDGVLVEVAGTGEAVRRERRTLDLMAALEFCRLHAHHAHQKATTADARTTTAITRALSENWSLRRIQKEVDRALNNTTASAGGADERPRQEAAGEPARSTEPTTEPGPAARARSAPSHLTGADERGDRAEAPVCSSTSDYFTLHFNRLKAATRAQLEAARAALDDARVLLDAQLQAREPT